MKRVYYMILMALCCALTAAAQDGRGDVVVHSDPRLAVLMKKKHADAAAAMPKPPKKHTDIKAVTTGTVTTTSVVAVTAPGTLPTGTVTGAAVAVTNKPAVLPAGTPPPVALPPGASQPAEVTPAVAPEVKPDAPPPAPARAPIFIHEKDERVIYTGKGFRVQIYSGADRERAINIKTEFMRNFPGVRTYLIYLSPTFRVKVGNYRTRAEAMSMYREAKEIYSPCVIVPDNITINTK